MDHDLDVAVVIPTRGRPALAREAVLSALAQSLPPRQVLVVSDGPSGGLHEALAGLPVTIIDTPYSGVAAARNTGIACARTEWVAFLDDDNYWHPEFLSEVAKFVQSTPDVQALNAHYWLFAERGFSPNEPVDFQANSLLDCLTISADGNPTSTMDHLEITGSSFRLLLARMRGAISTAVVKREVLLRAEGFPVGQICAEDWTMFVNVARFVEWHVVPRRLAYFRVHPMSNTYRRALLNGPATLSAILAVWNDDRLPWPAPGLRPSDYALEYRYTVQMALSTALKGRDARIYLRCLALGWRLIGPAHLLRALLPVGVADRVRKMTNARFSRRDEP